MGQGISLKSERNNHDLTFYCTHMFRVLGMYNFDYNYKLMQRGFLSLILHLFLQNMTPHQCTVWKSDINRFSGASGYAYSSFLYVIK